MSTVSEGKYWCPHGRISIQRVSGGIPIEIVSGGAFNTVVLGNAGYNDGGVYLPSRCTRQCVHYQRRFGGRRGHCALEPKGMYGPALLVAAALLAAAAVVVIGNRLYL